MQPKISEEMREYFRNNYVFEDVPLMENKSLDNIITHLKAIGCSQMQTVMLLYEELNTSFLEANRILLNSTTWNR